MNMWYMFLPRVDNTKDKSSLVTHKGCYLRTTDRSLFPTSHQIVHSLCSSLSLSLSLSPALTSFLPLMASSRRRSPWWAPPRPG